MTRFYIKIIVEELIAGKILICVQCYRTTQKQIKEFGKNLLIFFVLKIQSMTEKK